MAGDSPRRIAGILAALGFALVVLLGGGAAVFYARARLLDVAVAVIAIVVWAAVAARRPMWRPRSVLWPGLALVVGSLATSAIFSSNPRWGLEFTGYALLLSALYVLLVTLLRDQVIRARLLIAVTITCAVIVVAYLALVWLDWQRFWQALGSFTIPPLRPNDQALAYSNPSAAMAVAVLLYANAIGVLGWRGGRRGLLALLGIGVVVVAFLTGSRGGFAGVGLGFVGLAVVGLAIQGGTLVTRFRTDRAIRVAIGIAVVTAAVVVVTFWPVLERRLLTGGADLRVSFWLTSLRAMLEHPLFGGGPGMWPADRIRLATHPESDVYIPHAHNIEINAGAELGIVGLAVGVVMLVLVAFIVRDGLRSLDPDRRRWGYVAVFTVGYLVGHQQFDVFANAPAVIAAGALPIAMLDAGIEHPRLDPRVPRLVAVVALIGVLVTGPLLIRAQMTADSYERGVQAANAGRWDRASDLLRAAASDDPSVPIHQLAAGLTLARQGDLAAAARSFAVAAAADDYPIAWVNLAAVQSRMGDRGEAARSADRAWRLGRQHANVALPVAEVRRSIGDRDGAVQAMAAALVESPTLTSDPAWSGDSPLAAIYPDALRAALSSPDSTWGLLAEAGDLEGAAKALEDVAGPEREVFELYLAVVADHEAAEDLYAYAEREPSFHAAVHLAALAARKLGDQPRVERYRRLASSYTQFGALYGRLARAVVEPGSPLLFGNDTTTFYGPFTYYRPMPQDDLVPWLPHLIWD